MFGVSNFFKLDKSGVKRVYLVFLAATFLFANEVHAVSNIFVGLNTFATATISILAAVIVIGLVGFVVVGYQNGQINWAQILYGLGGVVLIAGIAANIPGFFAALGINITAAGLGYSDIPVVL